MKKSTAIAKFIGSCLGFLFALAAVYAVSWIVTCGIVKLITICFGLAFTWGMATGIWLIWILLKSLFSNNVTIKK